MTACASRSCSRARTRIGSAAEARIRHIPCDTLTRINPEGGPERTVTPRGPPARFRDRLSRLGDQSDPSTKKASRINRRTITESVGFIKPLSTTSSLRACDGMRVAWWFICESSGLHYYPGLIGNENPRRRREEVTPIWCAREFAQSRASSLRIHPHATVCDPPSYAVTRRFSWYATTQVSEHAPRLDWGDKEKASDGCRLPRPREGHNMLISTISLTRPAGSRTHAEPSEDSWVSQPSGACVRGMRCAAELRDGRKTP